MNVMNGVGAVYLYENITLAIFCLAATFFAI